MFRRITIYGPGLLGASLAQAIRERQIADEIAVWAHRAETRLACENASWCDDVFSDALRAAESAELIVLATPVDVILDLLREIGPHITRDVLVTDVGSTKSLICRRGQSALTEGATLVGAHPMAGSEKSGWRHARPDLFEGRTCFLTPLVDTPAEAVERVGRFWRKTGMQLLSLSPESHDEIVAHISHLPHVLAGALCAFLARKPDDWRALAGGGLRDSTRIAEGSPSMWKAILEHNQEEVLRSLAGFQEDLQDLERALRNQQWHVVQAILERGAEYRRRLISGPE